MPMGQQPQPDQYLAEIRASAGTLAGIIGTHGQDLPVPSCPGWTLRDLGAHLGWVHRWAAQTVATRATDRIPASSVPDSEAPPGAREQAAWLRAGADRVIEVIREAGSAPVWAFGSIVPAGFWARRQAQETMMHRADGELAAGREPALNPVLAADGIDEWLAQVADRGFRRRAEGAAVLPSGAVLRVEAVNGGGEWLVSTDGDEVLVRRGPGAGDVTVAGPPGPLLLVLVRRLPPDEPQVTVTGDGALLRGWLAATPF